MMDINLIKTNKFSYITLENVYTEEELNYLWKETMFICDSRKLSNPEITGSARDADGNTLKQNFGFWINDGVSNYLSLIKKPKEALVEKREEFIDQDYTLNLYYNTNISNTLMSYYEDNNYYDAHFDYACYTYLFWLCKEPKQFTGGNLYFLDVNEEIIFKNNFGILFPSWAIHSVEKVNFIGEKFEGLGRFCFSTFYTFK